MPSVGPAPVTAVGLGDAAEAVRRILADYEPTRPAGQLLGLLALAPWALGTRLPWEPDEPSTTTEVVVAQTP